MSDELISGAYLDAFVLGAIDENGRKRDGGTGSHTAAADITQANLGASVAQRARALHGRLTSKPGRTIEESGK